MSDSHQKAMLSLVNNPAFSDIKVKTSDGTVHAHRLILGVQLPKLLEVSSLCKKHTTIFFFLVRGGLLVTNSKYPSFQLIKN